MAKAKAKAKPSAKAAHAGGGRSFIWLQGLLCGAIVTLATPTALLLGILLLPGLFALMFERTAGHPVARTMLLCGLATCVAPVRELWQEGHVLASAAALALNPQTVALAWTAQAAGWLLTELIPFVIRIGMETASLTRGKKLRAERARFEEEWGLPPLD